MAEYMADIPSHPPIISLKGDWHCNLISVLKEENVELATRPFDRKLISIFWKCLFQVISAIVLNQISVSHRKNQFSTM